MNMPPLVEILRTMEPKKASDIHLQTHVPPMFRIQGKITHMTEFPVVDETWLLDEIHKLLPEKLLKTLDDEGTVDLAYGFPNIGRFRFSIFRQRGNVALVARRISGRIPDFEHLNLPPSTGKISEFINGLVLVTGPTGSGKSSTLAAVVNKINKTRECHILCIEDPIEFLYKNERSVITQREIGIDVSSFETALRGAVRQDPDVILAGEIRDRHTVEFALHSAETGHLVFATLHSSNASQTISRILNFFPQSEHHALRKALHLNLRAIISQVLLPSAREETPVVPAVEILFNTPVIGRLIVEERDERIVKAIQAGKVDGMQDFEWSLYRLKEDGFITQETALLYAENPHSLEMKFNGIFIADEGGIIT